MPRRNRQGIFAFSTNSVYRNKTGDATFIYEFLTFSRLFYVHIQAARTALATIPAKVLSRAPDRVNLVLVTFAANN